MTFLDVSSSLVLGPVSIHWYGLLVVAGILLGYFVIQYLLHVTRYQLPVTRFNDLFFWLVIWGFIGGRLYHVLNEIGYYWQNPIEIVKIWNGGLAIHGAILVGIIVIFYFSRRIVIPAQAGIQTQKQTKKGFSIFSFLFGFLDSRLHGNDIKSFFILSDLLVVGLALGQAIGRWGNYFNQELFGKPTEGFFKVVIDLAHRPAGFENIAFYHPTFLYESVLNVILFIILFVYYCRGRSRPAPTGVTTAFYLFGYGLIRFFVDFLRIDPRPFFGGLYLSQWVSLVMIAVGVVVWYTITRLKVGKSESL